MWSQTVTVTTKLFLLREAMQGFGRFNIWWLMAKAGADGALDAAFVVDDGHVRKWVGDVDWFLDGSIEAAVGGDAKQHTAIDAFS